MDDKYEKLRGLLGDLDWPNNYSFRFIIPSHQRSKASEVFEEQKLSFRESKKGNYVAVHFQRSCCSVEEVIDVYKLAARIPGVMSL